MSNWRRSGLPGRPRQLFFAFLLASIVAHATVLVALSPPTHDAGPSRPNALEVVILPPTPLPVAASDHAPLPSASSKPEPQRARAAAEEKPRPERTAPVLALSEPRVDQRRSFPVDAAFREPESAAPELKTRAASVAVAPPGSNAAYLSNPAPRYPAAARHAGEHGTVTLRVLVSREGAPARVDVEKSSGSAHLDRAALEAVKAWRFVPARQGAEPVESWMLVPVVFRLEGTS